MKKIVPVPSSLSRLFVVALVATISLSAVADQFPDWIFDSKITAEDEGHQDEFGREIAVDGDIVIVGAQQENGAGTDRGAAYLIDYTTGEELFKLTASDAADGDNFGQDVSISGNVAVVTADSKNMFAGTGYLFNVTTGVQGPTLVPSVVEAGAFFGVSCDIEGNYVIVGAPAEDLGENDRGAAYVFDATTGLELFRLTAPDGADFDYFGDSVAVSGNYAVVGAPGANGGEVESGKVYVFDLSDMGNFLHQAVPSVIETASYFGTHVAAHGDYLVAGADEEDAGGNRYGAAYLFDLATGNEVKRVVSSVPSDNGEFGNHVAISDDLMIIGARDEAAGGVERGAAYVFSVPEGNLLQRIIAPDADNEDFFGISVAINDEFAFAGADEEDNGPIERGALYVFQGTTLPDEVVDTCDTVLKTALLKKAKKLKKKAKLAKRKGQIAKAKSLKKRAKKLKKKANALC